MQTRDHRQAAPDFTQAFLWTLCLIVFMTLCMITAVLGYLWLAVAVWAMHAGISWLDRRLRR